MDEEEVLYNNETRASIGHSEPISSEDLTNRLRRAIVEDNIVDLRRCLCDNHDVNLIDDTGDTCVHTAVRYGSLNTLRYMLSLEEVRRDARTPYWETPLMLAVKLHASYDIVNCLAENGCDVNFANSIGNTPLHFAVEMSDPRTARLLVEKGADIEARSWAGFTPLGHAVTAENEDVISMLLYYNISVNEPCSYEGRTPFLQALKIGNSRIAELLIDYVDDFNVRDRNGRTAFALAVHNHLMIAVDIVDRGGDVHEHYCGVPIIFCRLGRTDRTLFGRLWRRVDVTRLCPPSTNMLLFTKLLLRFQHHLSTEIVLGVLEALFELKKVRDCFYTLYCRKDLYRLCKDMETRLRWTWILLSYAIPITCEEVESLYVKYDFCPAISAILSSEVTVHSSCWGPSFAECIIHNKEVKDLRYSVPRCEGNVPSLVQIARDVCRKTIYNKYQREPNYRAYNVIMKLEVPKVIKEILLLKRPIYM